MFDVILYTFSGFMLLFVTCRLIVMRKRYDKLYHEHEALKVHAKYVKEVSEALAAKLDGMREAISMLGLEVFVDFDPYRTPGHIKVTAEQSIDIGRIADYPREKQSKILGHMVEHAKYIVAANLKDFVKGQLGH